MSVCSTSGRQACAGSIPAALAPLHGCRRHRTLLRSHAKLVRKHSLVLCSSVCEAHGKRRQTSIAAHAANLGENPNSSGNTRIEEPVDDAMSRRNRSSLESLDLLLGTSDSMDDAVSTADWVTREAATARMREELLAQALAVAEAQAAVDRQLLRKKKPTYVYAIYYTYIVVYLAHSWLVATEGDLDASGLADGLVNDHIAVQDGGEVWRLVTSGFYCDNYLALFSVLAALVTIAYEVEAIFGPSRFWALFYLGTMTGALADAAFSEQPITYGPTNSIAGLVGALMGHYAANLASEVQAQALSSLKKEETEVEVFFGFKAKVALGPRARALLGVLVSLVAGGQGLLDLGDGDTEGSWIGLVASLFCGLTLGYLASPRFSEIPAPHLAQPPTTSGGADAAPSAPSSTPLPTTLPSSSPSSSSSPVSSSSSSSSSSPVSSSLSSPSPPSAADWLGVPRVRRRRSAAGIFSLYMGAFALATALWLKN